MLAHESSEDPVAVTGAFGPPNSMKYASVRTCAMISIAITSKSYTDLELLWNWEVWRNLANERTKIEKKILAFVVMPMATSL